MSTQEKMAVRHEIHINATPDRVWGVMASAEGIKKWLGPATYEPRQGSKIDFNVTHEGGKYYMFGEVMTFDPPHELAFTWTEQPVGGEAWPASTLVTLTLTPEGDGTRVRLTHSGFENLPADIAQEQFKGYVRGWEMYNGLPELKALVEAA
jgi:uncharacterized protein YndB with AHSA1/START domain